MKERPILFSGEMVRAILDGRKTQTRRVVKCLDVPPVMWKCPYGVPGDRLWVRETCNISDTKDAVMYLDEGGKLAPTAPPESENWCRTWKTCPSIHMPRWASRITLEIVNVRVERVQDIDEAGAILEGADASKYEKSYRYAFSQLWDSINAKRGFGWAANPWVWVIEFKKEV